ncbi:C2 domain protein [Oesophagostomum dentatum]|uniref:C2 domain protein n=1 Tax=Oesophagostomum dentatum TaxID=61180 RepID=A0A0B1TQ14_OESDE|nr:C2 domain protein [Oesophagostomum dentatum]
MGLIDHIFTKEQKPKSISAFDLDHRIDENEAVTESDDTEKEEEEKPEKLEEVNIAKPEIDMPTPKSSEEEVIKYVTLLVKIRLKEGQNLAIRDASGSSDPYVKFKYKERIVYKSSTIFKNLNPIWDEEFQMLADDMTSPITIEVFDYDRFCTDDFMGSATIDISQVKWFQPREQIVDLSDDASPDEELGTVSLTITVVPLTNDEKDDFVQKSVRGVLSEVVKKKEKMVQMWVSVVNVVLVEGRNLIANYNSTVLPDPYCKFKLGCEKYKSKSSSSSIRDTLTSVQETLTVVQNTLVFICALLQRVRNTFNFSSPWLSWLAIAVLSVVTVLLYFVPLRWIIMVWGINKFTKKLRNPHYIDNNEILDYLSRVPCDKELREWRDFNVATTANGKDKEKKPK